MRLKSRWVLPGGALLVALFCAAAAKSALAADKIRLGKAQGLGWSFLPADIGVEQGFFAKFGIDAEIVALAGDAKVQQVLASKSIEFGLGSGPGMAFAAKGSPAIAVAAFAGPPRNISAIVRADSPINNVADLRGKLIGVSTVGSLTDWLAKQMAVQEGWGQNGVRTVPLGAITASLAALKAHQVDASVLATEVGYQLAEQREGRVIVGMERYAPHFITHVVFARKDILAENPGLIERFLKGFFASIAFMKSHKAQTVATAERVLKQSPMVASETYDYEISMLTDDGRFDPLAVEVLKRSFVEMGTLDKKPANDELFTMQFLPVKP
jgi:NitT/TauT family transport system substrate-binding protein